MTRTKRMIPMTDRIAHDERLVLPDPEEALSLGGCCTESRGVARIELHAKIVDDTKHRGLFL